MLTNEDTQKFIEYLQEQARRVFEAQGQIAPIFMVLLPNKQLMLVPVSFDNDEIKYHTAMAIRRLVAEYNAEAVALITEAWAIEADANLSKEEVLKELESKKPSESAHRIECVNIMVSTPTSDVLTRANILRVPPDDETSPGLLQSWSKVDFSAQSDGLFSHFFQPRTAEEIEMTIRGKISALKKLAKTPEQLKELAEMEKSVAELSDSPITIEAMAIPMEQLKAAINSSSNEETSPFRPVKSGKKEYKN